MDEIWGALAQHHGGMFTRAQARDAGVGDRELSAAVRSRVLRRLRHGCYVPGAAYEALDDVGRHLLLARATLAYQEGPVALTGPTAAALHGLSTYGQDLSVVHLVRLDRGSARYEVGAKHHVLTHNIDKDLTLVSGLPVVTVPRAVWEVATLSSLEAAVCTADSALRLYPDMIGDLLTIAATFDRRPGSRRARLAVRLADSRSDSEGESLSRVLFHRHKIPKPEPHHHLFDADGRLIAILDFYWPEFHHAGEFDGKTKYTKLLRAGEEPGDAVFREKRREDAIRSQDLGMTRWTWRDLMAGGSPEFLRRLTADLERSRGIYGRRSA